MLERLASGVNFINILEEAFARAGPKSAKKQSNCQSFYAFGICMCKSCMKQHVGEIDFWCGISLIQQIDSNLSQYYEPIL